MANIVVLYCPGDEDRARWIAQAWRGGRATLCIMGPHRRRIALGARSVLIGLWSDRTQSHDAGLQMSGVLAGAPGRSMLVVWDGRPPFAAIIEAGVPIVVAPESPEALIARLESDAADMGEGVALASDMSKRRQRQPAPPARGSVRAQWLGLALGAGIVLIIGLSGMAPIAARLFGGAESTRAP